MRGYLLISVAEIRYSYDLVRLCHKFYFCFFQMKIPHIDEEKELYAGLCLGFFVLGVGESRSQKKFWSHAAARKIFLGLVGGPGTCSLKNFEKIVFRNGRNRIFGH